MEARWRSLVLILVLAMISVGIVGYFVGRLQGQAEVVQQATLRIQVENRLSTDQAFQILVNGKLKQTLTVPTGQTASVDVPVSFATGDGAVFDVEARAATGQRDADSVLITGPGTYIVSLRLG